MLEQLWTWLTEPLESRTAPELEASAQYPDIDAQLYERLRVRTANASIPTVKEALGLPAIYRAVSLLASAAASLNLIEYVGAEKAIVQSTVVRRPQKLWTPGAFVRDTVHHMAAWGESIWTVLTRDVAGFASSILPVAPYSMKSKEWDGQKMRWFSMINGREVEQDPANIIHIPLLRDPATGRGLGPLQVCGAAVNVAVEADRWAQRWFVGGMPSTFLKSDMPIDEKEATTVKEQWLADPPNLPKVGYAFTPQRIGFSVEEAQLNGARMFNRGEVALMFGIPGRLLEYAESGTSVTYANVGDLATELVRLTLAPLYLEQIEQAFSDLLARGREVRFDVEGFERADIKTRFEVYEKAVAVFGEEEGRDYAAEREGIRGTNSEVQPTPLRVVS